MDNAIYVTSAVVSDRGLSEKRPQNEDSFLEIRQAGIFAVADGVGGAQAGDVASQMAVEILGEAFTNRPPGADAEDVMKAAIEQANSAIYQMAQELPQLSSMATTLVALHLADSIATIGHVGDSRLYRLDPSGHLFRETDDHSVVAEEVRAGRMTEEQAENHPSKNIISRALGAEATVDIDLRTIMIEPGTAFLACSDGITRHVSDDEIRDLLTYKNEPAEICEYLKALCYERGAEDNLTAVVVKTMAESTQVEPPRTDEILDLDLDDPTMAAVRPPIQPAADSDEGILELDTQPLVLPESAPHHASEAAGPATDDDRAAETRTTDVAGEAESVTRDQRDEPAGSTEAHDAGLAHAPEPFSIYRDPEAEDSGSFVKLASYAGLVLIGGLLGLAFYHFALAPTTPSGSNAVPPLTEMRAANIPLSAFEENRRNVDRDPASYIARFGASPQDCEDFYLLGRAYLLTGDYLMARSSLTQARARLAEADPVNAKTLAADIATALVVTNDTTIQSMLRKEFEAVQAPPADNSNSNR